MSRKMEVLKLYKSLLRESSKFPAYNFRNYAIRRVRDAFREAKTLTDGNEIERKIADGYQNLDLIKRQVVVGEMFKASKLVIETSKS